MNVGDGTTCSTCEGGGDADTLVNRTETRTTEEVLAVLNAAQTIAISGHVNPDGDALGSAMALRELLWAMGKEVDILLGHEAPPPELYAFLPNYDFIYESEYAKTPDLFIAVDASTAKRIGTTERLIHTAGTTLVIDHHANYEGFAEHYYGDTTAPATASLVWKIIKESSVEPTRAMAVYCYVGIMTDTGRFAFMNTDRTAFADATEMIDLGVDAAELSQQIYQNKCLPAMRLEALVVDRIKFSGGHNEVICSYILRDDLTALGLTRDNTEQIPTILRSVRGVEVAVLFRDEGEEGVRVNLRSRGAYNVGAFACALGGGGHAGAAGVTLAMPLEEAMAYVTNKLVEELSASN